MTATPPDPFTCPVCDSCDHDMRGSVLEFMANVNENLKHAGEALLDALEVDGAGTANFTHVAVELGIVQAQLQALLEFTAEVAILKAVRAQ